MNVAALFAVFFLGFVLGFGAAAAPIGPVTILVIRRSLAGDWPGALRIGLGRVPPETVYCLLATFGTAALLDEFPSARTGIESVGTALLLVLGLWFAARDHTPPTDIDEDPTDRKGDWAGFFISALNPTLLLSWSAIAAIAIAFSGLEPTLTHKLLFPAGVASGIACGYLGLIWTMRRFSSGMNAELISYGIRGLGVLFVAMSLWNALRLFEVV